MDRINVLVAPDGGNSAQRPIDIGQKRVEPMDRHDLVLAPNLPFAPPRVDEALAGLFAAPDPLGAAGNLAGLPAVALPVGFSGGLPLSMQLVAPPLEEARLLSAAMTFQARTSHHLQRPPVPAPAAVAAASPRRRAGSSASP